MLDALNTSVAQILQMTVDHRYVLLVIIAIPWFIFFLNQRIRQRLLVFGIRPRHLSGLPGIFFVPFLHADFNHLFFNSIPLLVLSNFVLMNGIYYFLIVSFSMILISGLLIWCFARPGIHLGASALITAYWGLLVCNIVNQASLTSIILGVLCLYFFAGIFLGIFPRQKGVSWEGHLFGLLTGVLMAYILKIAF